MARRIAKAANIVFIWINSSDLRTGTSCSVVIAVVSTKMRPQTEDRGGSVATDTAGPFIVQLLPLHLSYEILFFKDNAGVKKKK